MTLHGHQPSEICRFAQFDRPQDGSVLAADCLVYYCRTEWLPVVQRQPHHRSQTIETMT